MLLVILVIVNSILLRLPLVGSLGYEFSAVNAVLLFLIGGLLTIYTSRDYPEHNFSLFELWHQRKKNVIIFLSMPFLIGLVSTVFFSKCPVLDGAFFYLVITVPSYFFGIVAGFYMSVLSQKNKYLLFGLSFLLIICLPLNELFFNPQVFFYNPIIGYFPGTIYDEDLRIDRLLIAYRLLNISFMIFILSTAYQIRSKKVFIKAISLLLVILIAAVFSIFKPSLHLSTDKETLNKNLANTITTQNFVIHFGKTQNLIKSRKYVALLHEYYLDQIKIQLDVQSKQKVDSYIFQNKNQKQELIGAGNADIAKPWLKQIYLNYDSYEETLKHELVHVVASNFGATFLQVADNFNSAMIEGIAVAIDNNYDGMTAHYLAKLAWEGGYRVPIKTLFSGMNFFTQTTSVSYIYAGSFIKFLIDKFGVGTVKKLYHKTDFQKFCGENIDQLSVEYQEFLQNCHISFNKNKAQLYFGAKTIFKKYCPRFAASQTRKASEYLANGKFENALKLFQKVYDYSESYNSLLGIVQTLSKQKKFYEAECYLKNEIDKFRTSQNYFSLEIILGDLLVETNRLSEAIAEYDSLLNQNPHIVYTNEVSIRKLILSKGIDSLKLYFKMSNFQKLNTLVGLNDKEIRYFSIPKIVQLAENSNQDLSNIFVGMKGKLVLDNYQSSYAAMSISKYFLKQMDLNNAKIFAVKALQSNLDDDAKHVFVETLRKVNWFNNYINEINVN